MNECIKECHKECHTCAKNNTTKGIKIDFLKQLPGKFSASRRFLYNSGANRLS